MSSWSVGKPGQEQPTENQTEILLRQVSLLTHPSLEKRNQLKKQQKLDDFLISRRVDCGTQDGEGAGDCLGGIHF